MLINRMMVILKAVASWEKLVIPLGMLLVVLWVDMLVVLRVQRPASRVVHVLRVSDLARPIDPDRCTVACRAAGGPDGTQAVTARLATSDPTTAWGPSLTARPGSFFALR